MCFFCNFFVICPLARVAWVVQVLNINWLFLHVQSKGEYIHTVSAAVDHSTESMILCVWQCKTLMAF